MNGLGWMAAAFLLITSQTDDQQLFRRAVQKLETSDLQGAAADFESLQRRTGRPEFYYYLATCRLKLGEYEKARAHFRQALIQKPDSWQIHLGLGQALFHLDRLDEAAETFQKVLSLRAETFEAQYHLGLIDVRRRNCSQALSRFESVIRQSKHHLGAAYNLAVCYGRLGRDQEARQWTDRHGQLSAVLDRIESLRKAASFPTSTAANWIDLGNALLEIEDWTPARKAYQKALEMSGATEIHYYLGFVRFKEGHPDKAIEHYIRFLKEAPENYQAFFNLGLAYRRAGRLEDALGAFQTASRLAPNDPLIRVPALEMALTAEKFQQASDLGLDLTRDFPTFAHGHFLLSKALAGLGRKEGARLAVREALALEPGNALFRGWLAQLEEKDRR